ncbi:putative replication factor c subunit 1 [Dermatophagoides farinae]|nr:putative replication factor c subunit 1 [Dermatophagoides farinae]
MSSNKITDYFIKRSNVLYNSSNNKNENNLSEYRKNGKNVKTKTKSPPKIIADYDDSTTDIDDDNLTEIDIHSSSTEVIDDDENEPPPATKPKRKKKQQVVIRKSTRKINNETATNVDPVIQSSTIDDMNIWTQKYRPKTIDNMIGQTNEIKTFKNWLENWDMKFNNDDKYDDEDDDDDVDCVGKCFYIFGSNGIGKTSMVYAVAKDCGYNILEYNATIKHLTPKSLQNELYESSQSYLIDNSTWQNNHEQIFNGFSKSLILFDDIDAIIYENKSLNELWRSLKTIIRYSRKPIVITSDLQPSFLCNEQNFFHIIQLRPVRFELIIEHLDQIFNMESIDNKLTNHNGDFYGILFESNDLRKMINQLDFWFPHKQIHNHHQSQSLETNLKTYYQHYMNKIFMNTEKSLDKQSKILETLSNDDLYQTNIDRFLNKNDEMDENRYNAYSIDKRYTLINENDNSNNNNNNHHHHITMKKFHDDHLWLYQCDHNFICTQMTTDLTFESLQMIQDYYKYNDLYSLTKFDYLSLFEFVIESFPGLFSSLYPLHCIIPHDDESNQHKHRTRSSQKRKRRLQFIQIEYFD